MASKPAAKPRTPRKVGRPERFTVEQVGKALLLSGGIINRTARRLKCDRRVLQNYLHRHPELQDCIDEAKDIWLDDSEDQLRAAAKRGEPWAVKFTLERLGADRGWAEKRELSGRNGAPLPGRANVVVIQVPDNGRDVPMIEERVQVVLPAPEGSDGEG